MSSSGFPHRSPFFLRCLRDTVFSCPMGRFLFRERSESVVSYVVCLRVAKDALVIVCGIVRRVRQDDAEKS